MHVIGYEGTQHCSSQLQGTLFHSQEDTFLLAP